jgi:uncharacterized membrane protein YfcA
MDITHLAAAFGAGFLAGMINSVAGGGTLLSFPTLVWLGLPPIVANATNTVGIWPGSMGGAWGYRKELGHTEPRLLALVAPSLIGGILGALLLRWTPPATFGCGPRRAELPTPRQAGWLGRCSFNCWWQSTADTSARASEF